MPFFLPELRPELTTSSLRKSELSLRPSFSFFLEKLTLTADLDSEFFGVVFSSEEELLGLSTFQSSTLELEPRTFSFITKRSVAKLKTLSES